MKPERLLLFLVVGLLAFVSLKFPIWGVIAIERKLDTYPLVSHDTIVMLDEMGTTLADFDKACGAHQLAVSDLNFIDYDDQESLQAVGVNIDAATADMYAAVARRKALAAKADWSLVKSMLVGGQGYTHSTWLCAPAYATFTTQVNVGFTPTYDPPAS